MSYFFKVEDGKKYVTLRILNVFIDSVLPIANVIVPGLIINELMENKRVSTLATYIVILCIIPIINQIKEITLGVIINKISKRITRCFEVDLHKYIADMEFSSLESPQIAVQKSRIINGEPGAPIEMLDILLKLCRSALSMIYITTIISSLNSIVIGIILTIVVFNSFINKKMSIIIYNHGVEISKKNNVFWSEFDNLSNPQNGKEVRIYNIKEFLINRYLTIGHDLDELEISKDINIKRLQFGIVIMNSLQQLVLYVFPIIQVLWYNLEIGTMTIFMTAGNQLSNSLNEFARSFLEMSNYCIHVKEIKEFRSMPSMIDNGGTQKPVLKENSIIEFKNVSFMYPGDKDYVLKDINLKIPFNQKLCIVGENGSGKSTFIKLLTGLYYPSKGEIFLDGTNIREFSRTEYMRLFSPVFQDFCKYKLPLSLNITLEEMFDEEKLSTAIYRSNLKILTNKLQEGCHTYLGKSINESGFEPSGGEAQRIAIARAIYQDRPIYILDEPTAALDPATEFEIYSTFSKIMAKHTTILITHRMSAVQLSDYIAVFKDGNIIEYGTHQELYEQQGFYAEMFNKQAQFYRDNTFRKEK